MESSYVLWHTQRQGWVTKSGITSTDYVDAKWFGRKEAILFCTRQLNHELTPNVVPVKVDDITEILA